MEPPADKAEALVDAAGVLDGLGAGYMLVGGVAVAVHTSLSRTTIDIDLAVDSRLERRRLVEAFVAAGFALKGEHPHTIHLRHHGGEASKLAFDVGFDGAIARAATFEVRGHAIRIATRPDLIALKERAAADPRRRRSKALQDRADVELLRGDVPEPDEGW